LRRAPQRLVRGRHLAQSLDGRIATRNGMSRWLSGAEDLLHTHRMRAMCDAVVVGVNTVLSDDPQLTVRRCTGAHPVRVVIDPERRLDGSQRIFHDGAAATLVLAAADRARAGEALARAEVVPVPRGEWGWIHARFVASSRGAACHRSSSKEAASRYRAFLLRARSTASRSPWPAHTRLGTARHPVAGDRRPARQPAAGHAPLRARERRHDRMRLPRLI
jgi:hypothetical protein